MRTLFLLSLFAITALQSLAQSNLIATAPWRLTGEAELESMPPLGVPSGGQSAFRITTKIASPNSPANVQLSAVVPSSTEDRQWLRFHFWGRSSTSSRIEIAHESNSEPFAKSLFYQLRLTSEWKEYAIPYPSSRYLAAGSVARVRAGFDQGVVEISGLSLEDFGRASVPPRAINFEPFGEQSYNDNWKPAALERIVKYRQGNLRIRIVDRFGRPVSNARVDIEQTAHKYLFGTAVAEGPLLGNDSDSDRYRYELQRLFRYAVPEDALKWDFRGTGETVTADRMLTWLADRGIPARGTNLLWPSYKYLPASLRNLRGEALRNAIEKRVRETVARYRGRVVVWDVINEAFTNNEILKDNGRDLLWKTFEWARDTDPDVALAYNDFDIANNRAGANDNQRKGVVEIIKEIDASGAPIGILADQAHMNTPLTPMPKVIEAWEELSQFGWNIEITEFDISFGGPQDEQLQAKYLEDVLIAAFSVPKTCSFVLRGFWDGSHRLGDQGAGLFRRDWTARPAAAVWERLTLKDWWTRVNGLTDANGFVTKRVFLGEHLITVTLGDTKQTAEAYVKDAEDGLTELVIELEQSPQEGQ